MADALALARSTAQHAESLGFTRYWLAEHHNMPGIASSATAVLEGHVPAGTDRICVGSGGIMLPNHAPLTVAEAFGTLAELYPGRIDLGLGRAPGTDALTLRALRRDRVETEEDFPQDVAELQRLLGPPQPGQHVVAMPGAGTQVPVWLLGSSLFSARLAAQRGLPYAFASHFAPRLLMQALATYRAEFQPREQGDTPCAIVALPLVAAPTDAEAEYLASSVQQRVLGILTHQRACLGPPVAGFWQGLSPEARQRIEAFLALAVVGGPDTVRQRLQRIAHATRADEFLFVCDVYDPALRHHSQALAAAAMQSKEELTFEG